MMVVKNIVPIVWEFVFNPCVFFCEIVIKDDLKLRRNKYIFDLEPEQHSLHAAVIYQNKQLVLIEVYVLGSISFEKNWDRG